VTRPELFALSVNDAGCGRVTRRVH
jgi:hypothetical protein